jgi:hypothetical protein
VAQNLNQAVADAGIEVPGMVCAAAVLVPDGIILGGTGAELLTELEPLVRSAARCFPTAGDPDLADRDPAVEFAFVGDEEIIVIQGGRSEPRLAFAVICTRETNLAFVLAASRKAIATLEQVVDMRPWVR